MAWLRIDDRVRTHPKILQAGPTASWLWFCGICYCREHLTDGFIARAVVPTLTLTPNIWKHAEKLVAVNLWESVESGYQVHDFLEWNPSKAEVVASRKEDAERKRKGHGIHSESERNPSGLHADSSRARAGAPARAMDLGLSSGIVNSEESARETVRPIAWNESYHVRNCPPWAIRSACRKGLCIPKYLWPQWEARLEGPSEAASASLRRFCEDVIARTPPQPGDRAEDFWPAHFAAHFGQSAPSISRPGKAARTVSALDAAAAQLRGQS